MTALILGLVLAGMAWVAWEITHPIGDGAGNASSPHDVVLRPPTGDDAQPDGLGTAGGGAGIPPSPAHQRDLTPEQKTRIWDVVDREIQRAKASDLSP